MPKGNMSSPSYYIDCLGQIIGHLMYLCDLDLEVNYMGHVRDTPPHYDVLMCQVI